MSVLSLKLIHLLLRLYRSCILGILFRNVVVSKLRIQIHNSSLCFVAYIREYQIHVFNIFIIFSSTFLTMVIIIIHNNCSQCLIIIIIIITHNNNTNS